MGLEQNKHTLKTIPTTCSPYINLIFLIPKCVEIYVNTSHGQFLRTQFFSKEYWKERKIPLWFLSFAKEFYVQEISE